MTTEQTRQLGIEFERRLQQISPDFEITNKLDTDTIYSFLNEYQYKYINDLFLLEDQINNGSKSVNKINDTIKNLITHKTISVPDRNPDTDKYCEVFKLPNDYYFYIRSTSIIDKHYKTSQKLEHMVYAPNVMIKQSEVTNVINSYCNDGGIIRKPLVVLESTQKGSPYIKVIHDRYTHLDAIDLVYCRQPYNFNVLNYDDEDKSDGATHSYCELPYSCFNELVEGAIQLYIQQYKYALQKSNKTESKQ